MKSKTIILFFIILAVAIIIRLFYLFNIEINSDDAIVGLMGRHILMGELPVYYYGQNYMGALGAYLSAFVFFLFGSSPLTLKLAPFSFSIIFVAAIFFLVKELSDDRTALVASLYAAVPPFFLTTWSVTAGGGYIETLLFGNIILLLTTKIIISGNKGNTSIALLGIICGIAWWIHQLAFYYMLSALILFLIYSGGREALFGKKIILWRGRAVFRNRRLGIFSKYLGKVLNYFFILIIFILFIKLNCGRFYVNFGFFSINFHFRECILFLACLYLIYLLLFGDKNLTAPKGVMIFLSAFTMGNMPACIYGLSHRVLTENDFLRVKNFFKYFGDYWKMGMPIILGLKKSGCGDFISYRLIGAIISGAYAYFIFHFLFNIFKKGGYSSIKYVLPVIMFIIIPLVFSCSKYGWFSAEPRYILPLYTSLAIFYSVAVMDIFRIKRIRILSVFFGISVILFNVIGNFANYEKIRLEKSSIQANDKELVDFLLSKGIYYCYADYWTAYKITFETNERIICASFEHSRYPKYEELVSKKSDPAYIIQGEEENNIMQKYLEINRILCEVYNIRDYRIYYSIKMDIPKKENIEKEKYARIKPKNWESYANINNKDAEKALDGDLSTRWTTNNFQEPGMFFIIDLKDAYEIAKVEMTSWKHICDYPRGCRIETSLDGKCWEVVKDVPEIKVDQLWFPLLQHPLPIYQGWLRCVFSPVIARYVKITQTGKSDDRYWWSINEVCIYSRVD